MVWGKGSFKKEYRRILPEIIEILEREGVQKPENLECRGEEYGNYAEFISNFRCKHPGDILKRYHLTEFLIDGLLRLGVETEGKLREVLYSELKDEDARKLDAKYLKKINEDIEDYHRGLLILLSRNSFLQLCREYFGQEFRERLRAEYIEKQRKESKIKQRVRRFKKKREQS